MLLACVAFATLASFTLEPTDDVWVYPHASDASKDVYLRVWGTSERSVATDPTAIDEYGYSYLKFDTSSLPKGKELKEAVLVLTHVGNPGYEHKAATLGPIEVRALSGDFLERTWEHPMSAKVAPSAKDVDLFGRGTPDAAGFPSENDFKIRVPLKDGFGEYLGKAQAAGYLGLALTSKLDPQNGGMKAIYRLFSRNAAENQRPKLTLTFAD